MADTEAAAVVGTEAVAVVKQVAVVEAQVPVFLVCLPTNCYSYISPSKSISDNSTVPGSIKPTCNAIENAPSNEDAATAL